MDDWTQLADYTERGEERAFAAIVARHVGLVYGAAFRQLNNAAQAEEVTQMAFLALAQNARKLNRRSSMATWLYSTASHKAIDLLRSETARTRREQAHATIMQEDSNNDPEAVWSEIAPVLEEAMRTLGETDRTAVLLRYFEERPLRDVSEQLGMSEVATRKRVSRGLEKLRKWFAKRGIPCTSSALGIALGAYATKSAPAAVAESAAHLVFSQSVSQTASASLAAPSLATTITAMKLPLVTGLLVGLAVPISMGFLEQRNEAHVEATLTQSMEPSGLTLPPPEMSELMAAWIKLRAEYGPNAGSMPQLYEAIGDLKDIYRLRAFRVALVAEWAQLDPLGALDFFQKENDGNRMAEVLRIWLEQDPSAAVAAMKANGKDWEYAIGNVLEMVAEAQPQALAELVSFTVSARPYGNAVTRSFASAARRDLVGMRDAAESMDGEMRREALAGVAEAWAEKDGDAALAWVEGFESSEDRSWAMRRLLRGWAKSKPFATLDHLATSTGSGTAAEKDTIPRVLATAAEVDFEGTLDWIAKHPGQLGSTSKLSSGFRAALGQRLQNDVSGTLALLRNDDHRPLLLPALQNSLHSLSEDELTQVLEWTDTEANPEITEAIRPQVLDRMARQSPEKAIELITSLVSKDSTDSKLLVQLAAPHVHDLESFERLSPIIEQAFPEYRESLLEAALSQTAAFDLDPEQWNGYLDQLPAESRNQVITREAGLRVGADPAAAIAWADTLPEADRTAAYLGLAKTWAHADSYEASEWIATLPSGEIRDNAALMLVIAVAQSEPDSAWQWAQTIQSPEQRLGAMQSLLPLFGDAAADVIEQSTLDVTDKSTLSERLNTPSGSRVKLQPFQKNVR